MTSTSALPRRTRRGRASGCRTCRELCQSHPCMPTAHANVHAMHRAAAHIHPCALWAHQQPSRLHGAPLTHHQQADQCHSLPNSTRSSALRRPGSVHKRLDSGHCAPPGPAVHLLQAGRRVYHRNKARAALRPTGPKTHAPTAARRPSKTRGTPLQVDHCFIMTAQHSSAPQGPYHVRSDGGDGTL